MIVKTNSGSYKTTFIFDKTTKVVEGRKESIYTGGTLCLIEKLDADNKITETVRAYAKLNPKDKFCKKSGKKTALTKALKILSPTVSRTKRSDSDKEFRKSFWDKLNSTHESK
jgi:hypothetical protein